MKPAEAVVDVLVVAVVLSAAAVGFVGHIAWLVFTDWSRLGEVCGLFGEVIGV